MERQRTATTSTSPSYATLDSTPLLGTWTRSRRSFRSATLRGAARFLRRASSRRIMREPSRLVRERAAEQLEERQIDLAYSPPVVLLDVFWNLAFVVVAIAVLVLSRDEMPSMPLRLWIAGYALQCVLHMVCVRVECRRRRRTQGSSFEYGPGSRSGGSSVLISLQEVQEARENNAAEDRTSVAKHLQSANTMLSFIWWIVGFYWVSTGGQTLTLGAPQLYWLCIVYLAFDVFLVVFCIALACVVGIAVCCCLPCIITFLYAVADQEGASDEDIHQLPKYKFQKIGEVEKLTGEISGPFGGLMIECSTDAPIERVLSAEDAECSVCLSAYDDGIELRELPCNHHFHCACIDKWLHINATCPLCKYSIKRANSSEEGV